MDIFAVDSRLFRKAEPKLFGSDAAPSVVDMEV